MDNLFEISAEPLDIAALSASLTDRTAGAFTSFEGWVRDHNDGRQVDGLDYEVFAPLALAEGAAILEEARQKFKVTGVRAVHRHGMLKIGDCAVWVGVISSHRDEAFRACRYVIDEVKHRLPIWKKERYRDGTAEWVNCQHIGAGHADHAHGDGHSHAGLVSHESGPAFAEADFYARQIRLPEVGTEGQAKLKAAKVLIVGAGGLGSPAGLMLAAAGVGTIGILEFDTLEASNLHRQVLYAASQIGEPKAEAAKDRLKALNPFIDVRVHDAKADAETLPDLFGQYDIVLDCTDNFATKYLLTDAAVLYGKPVVQASIHRFEGQLLTIDPKSTGGCLRCLWPAPPPEGLIGNCAEVGVLGVTPGLFGTLQASEALKIILGLPGVLDRHLLIMDALTLESRRIARRKDADCPVCGSHPTIHQLQQNESVAHELDAADLTPEALARFHIVDLRETEELAEHPLPQAHHAPFSRFDAANPTFDASKPVLLVCASGRRSNAAAQQLRAQGWNDVFSLIGGAKALGHLFHQAAE
jgi:molybdopterin/thiamine biosynthesis adenylyltransferase/molybdopterin synthase catalytic subunit/rhodanese-related sulfurtransferase